MSDRLSEIYQKCIDDMNAAYDRSFETKGNESARHVQSCYNFETKSLSYGQAIDALNREDYDSKEHTMSIISALVLLLIYELGSLRVMHEQGSSIIYLPHIRKGDIFQHLGIIISYDASDGGFQISIGVNRGSTGYVLETGPGLYRKLYRSSVDGMLYIILELVKELNRSRPEVIAGYFSSHTSVGCKVCGVHTLHILPNGRRVFACDMCTKKYGIMVRATGTMPIVLVRKIIGFL